MKRINQLTKTLLVKEAQALLWRLNRNRSNAKRSKKTDSTMLRKYDRAIKMANRRYERRTNLPIELPLVMPGQGRIYKVR